MDGHKGADTYFSSLQLHSVIPQSNFTTFCAYNRTSVTCNWGKVYLFDGCNIQVCLLTVTIPYATTTSALTVQSKMVTTDDE